MELCKQYILKGIQRCFKIKHINSIDWLRFYKKMTFLIEIKIRDTHFDELILETKKLRDLKSKVLV